MMQLATENRGASRDQSVTNRILLGPSNGLSEPQPRWLYPQRFLQARHDMFAKSQTYLRAKGETPLKPPLAAAWGIA